MAHIKDEKRIKAFGKNLVKIRKEKNITQEDLVSLTGMSLAQIGRIERGEIATSISIVFALADALKVKPKELFDF